jgi:hypothetical protein
VNPFNKAFKIPPDQIKRLVPKMGGCYASDRIIVDGLKVGSMYRELPDREYHSGWTFMAGDESEDYIRNVDHFGIYEVNTLCNYDPAIIPHLDAVYGYAFVRVEGTDRFEEVEFPADVD